jgi:phage/plasmid-like protein (TIGR03299 family)
MSHDISTTNGRASIAYTGSTPWHGLGQHMDGLQTVDAMLAAAGLEWTVSTAPLFCNALEVPGYRAIVRGDSNAILGVVTDRYRPIQNRQAGELMDAVVTEGQASIEVAGALGAGERCWMLAQIPGTFEISGRNGAKDAIRPYILAAWGHDGKHGLALKSTYVRVVCNNTLTAALGSKWSQSADVNIKHTNNAKVRIDEAQRALGLIRKQVDATAEAYQALAARDLTRGEARDYFARVLPYPTVAPSDETAEQAAERLLGSVSTTSALRAQASEAITRIDETRDIFQRLLFEGAGHEAAGHTAWGAYNAVTAWTDHVYPVLQSGKVSATRQSSVLFGSYAGLKDRALSSALELVS